METVDIIGIITIVVVQVLMITDIVCVYIRVRRLEREAEDEQRD